MAFRPTVIEGGGKPEPDAEALAPAEVACNAIRAAAGAGQWFYLVTEPEVGEPWPVTFYGDALEISATVEELARQQKLGSLGFGFDE